MTSDETDAPLLAADEKSKRKLSPRAQALIKTIGGATVVLYALGWAIVFARQDTWGPSVRATYGYQLGWVTCLVVCAIALVLRRGQAAAAQQDATQDPVCVSARQRVRRRRFVTGGATK